MLLSFKSQMYLLREVLFCVWLSGKRFCAWLLYRNLKGPSVMPMTRCRIGSPCCLVFRLRCATRFPPVGGHVFSLVGMILAFGSCK